MAGNVHHAVTESCSYKYAYAGYDKHGFELCRL